MAAYAMAKTRLEFTFDRIIGQPYPLDIGLRNDTNPTLVPPTLNTGRGEVRVLLDTLYEETIQKLKTLVADRQNFQQQKSPSAAQDKYALQDQLIRKMVDQHAHQTKQEVAKYMTAWLRANWTNPYPDDEDLEVMAAHCRTTVQVINNWLINARTRKWRPSIVKAGELGRPADLLLEDSVNIFDGKPLREINPTDYQQKPQAWSSWHEEPSNDEDPSAIYEEDVEPEDQPPAKRYRSNK